MSRSASARASVRSAVASGSTLSRLVADMSRRLPTCDTPEDTADRHADTGRVALADHVAGHDLSRREHVLGGGAVLHDHARLPVHAGAKIGEGDAGANRIAVERRRIDAPGPVRF